jgi:hypothetical protein
MATVGAMTAASLPTGGTLGQILTKNSASNYDATWSTTTSGLTPTAVKTGAYTAATGELVLASAASAGFTITLPTTSTAGATAGVKKVDTSANVVTVVATGKTIDGDANATLNAGNAAAEFVYDGANWRIGSTALLSPAVATGTDSDSFVSAVMYMMGAY